MAMVDVIRADEMSRLGVCADDDCEDWCWTCPATAPGATAAPPAATATAVAAYRARQAAGD